MKKILIACLAAALAAGVLAGCGADSSSSTTDIMGTPLSSEVTSSEESSTVSSETSSIESEVSSAISSETSSAASSQSAVSSKPPAASSKPATSSKPAASSKPPASSKPTASSKPAVSSKPAATTVSVKQVRDAIAKAYGNDYLPNGEIPKEVLDVQFPVTASLVEEKYGESPMISVNPDKLVIVKAVAGKGPEVEKEMIKARDQLVENAMVYPKDAAKLNACRVVRSGDYVAFLMLGAIDDNMIDATDAQALQFAQKEVQRGVDAFYAVFK